MAESQNFKELLQLLNDCQVDYLIVGGYAAMRYAGATLYQRSGHLGRAFTG